MVVVMDAPHAGVEAGAAAVCHHAHELRRLSTWLQGAGRRRSGDGIHGAVLAIGVAGIGAAHALAPGAGIFQPCSARAQA